MDKCTSHAVCNDDARSINLPADSVDLIVTSPPYPMIEMWDDVFAKMNPDIGKYLDDENGDMAFELMHTQLESVWNHVSRVVADGGFVCINIGDATRSIGDTFQLYPNTSRIVEWFRTHGFHVLPRIYWNKPTSRGTKFMGSGALPPNQYPTLEHEHILIFRKGDSRRFEPNDTNRYESAYFWEERNLWFNDHWVDIGSSSQQFDGESRDRSAAFPFILPYRLINMFSVYDDTVLDPFLGTGTTSLAAMVSGRDSIGYEIERDVAERFLAQLDDVPDLTQHWIETRIERHQRFIDKRISGGSAPKYESEHYPFRVVSGQEQNIRFYEATGVVEGVSDGFNNKFVCDIVDDDSIFTRSVEYDVYDRSIPSRLTRYETFSTS